MRLLERLGETTVKRFESNFSKTKGCWEWKGALSSGYGRFGFMGKVLRAHRFSYLLYKDEIPAGLLVRHSCNTTRCVNPLHLVLGTSKDNVQDCFYSHRHFSQTTFPKKLWRLKKLCNLLLTGVTEMALSPEAQAKVQLWRQKAREGTLTQDEMREAIVTLRQDRVAAAGVSAASRAKKSATAAKKAVNSDDLLSELDGM